MTLNPIIHCLVDPEPEAFHAVDLTATYAVNLSFEVQTDLTIFDQTEEDDAQAKFGNILAALSSMRLHIFKIDLASAPPMISLADDPLEPHTISAPDIVSSQGDVIAWLDNQKPGAGTPYWTSRNDAFNPNLTVDAEKAGAAPRSRAAQAWNAPVGHMQGLTHLLRIVDVQKDEVFVVLPFFDDIPAATSFQIIVHQPTPGQWQDAVIDCTYDVLGGLGPWTCRTNLIGRLNGNPIIPAPPTYPVSDVLTDEGFLKVNPDAQEIHRFLRMLEERAGSIMLSANALHHEGIHEIDLETMLGFDQDRADSSVYHWGRAVWYVVTRLLTALDNHILALIKPVFDGEVSQPDPRSEGEVLAPLVTAILDELAGLDEFAAIEGQIVARCIRNVLIEFCPLVRGGDTKTRSQLVDALFRVYDLAPAAVENGNLKPAEPKNLISSMLGAYRSGGYNQVPSEAKSMVAGLFADRERKSVATLSDALIDLEQILNDESGSERALIGIFETVEPTVGPNGTVPENERLAYRIAASLMTQMTLPQPPPISLVQAIRNGWEKYKAILEGPFNAAEAIRRAVSTSFVSALLKTVRMMFPKEDPPPVPVAVLRDLTRESNFYKWRILRADIDRNAFKGMIFPLMDADGEFRPDNPEMRRRLDDAYMRAIAPLVAPPEERQRFTPDSFPLPLPIQIAFGIDGREFDEFAKAYNGICVAVRRLDEKDPKWAYANLADLRWTAPQVNGRQNLNRTPDFPGALHPMMPAVADGRAMMFIEYEGFPFADATNPARLNEDAPLSSAPFYTPAPHEFSEKDQFARLPRLAYGRWFDSFSFAVSNAGVLPPGLQKSFDEPWLPRPDIERAFEGPWPEPDVLRMPYQRRTAVARMAVIEQPNPGKPRRVGESIVGVQPLCGDYPRLGVVADDNAPGTIELFRDGDGLPRMHIPRDFKGHLDWRLDDLKWGGDAPATLTLSLFTASTNDPSQTGLELKVDADLRSLKNLRLVAYNHGGRGVSLYSGDVEVAADTVDLPKESEFFWLRLQLKSADKVSSLSFNQPDDRRPAEEEAPLLLLRPNKDVWRQDLPNTTKMRASTPRVTYLDFMRWMSNSTLRDNAYSDGADQFERVLLLAYLMRHLDAGLAQYLDNLPDPAVEAIRVELMTTDSLSGRADADVERFGNLRGRLATFVKDKIPAIVNGWEATRLKKTNEQPVDQKRDLPLCTPSQMIEQLFKPLDELFSFEINITADTSFSFSGGSDVPAGRVVMTAVIPEGSVAQISMHSEVSSLHFISDNGNPTVLHEGLKQYAKRQTKPGDRFLYPSAAIRVETMLDYIETPDLSDWMAAAGKMIEAVPIAGVRRFDIVTKQNLDAEVDRDLWRVISEIDVTTQRWRISGRPIYHFIQPREHRLKNVDQGPALPLKWAADDNRLSQFESEAFFDRPEIDAQTITQKVAPLGTKTVLQQHPWDSPSATYFRHRFTLRSRYAGALRSDAKRSVDAWLPKRTRARKEDGWTMRVAMLADLSRLILTRPQLRALIPLTTAPGGERSIRPIPPMAAILQEPPFSRGGLADRIAPELKTGFGYGFEKPYEKDQNKDKTAPTVEIRDARKEIGPNPQLDYEPFDIEKVLGLTLRGEGPFGLTFDLPDAPAPAFANSMLSLRPMSLTGDEPPLEEALMAVTLRRYLDPHWVYGSVADDTPDPILPADQTNWIDLSEINGMSVRLTFLPKDGVPAFPVAEINIAGPEGSEHYVVNAWKEPIDKVKGYRHLFVAVASVEKAQVEHLSILHQPIAPGRFSTSILATLQSISVSEGESGAPLVLASFEWSNPVASPVVDGGVPKDGPVSDLPSIQIEGALCSCRKTMASATTNLRWVQLSRDFEIVRVVDPRPDVSAGPIAKPYAFRDMVASVSNGAITFNLLNGDKNVAICSSTLDNPYPIHVHRHIGFITTRVLSELGRPVEVFSRKALAGGQSTTLLGGLEGDEQAVRIVEFETPASIVCDSRLPSIPTNYKSAYFDLVRTGYRGYESIIVTIRFIGSFYHLGLFKSFKVALKQPSKAGGEVVFDLTALKAPASGVKLILRPATGSEQVTIDSWLIEADGRHSPAPAAQPAVLDLSGLLPGFWIDVNADMKNTKVEAEFWTDISVLHSAQQKTPSIGQPAPGVVAKEPMPGPSIDLDFDWLFSPQEGEASALVTPAGLAGMTEAQARIVSVSPPVPIRSSGSS
ncbi:hypothetical protein [Neorhizobium galegae]|uniref:hypothetical protein n=1 Tax=Neorhizobium galegae TaxID=399 RepID=UPI0006211158|nr:hypothetical protein [Neorhizobium galegae]CDZ54442.1 Hypothetical protein NGAL_HAMBI2427_56450 [Neorhizobium galegae bv. orientalis]